MSVVKTHRVNYRLARQLREGRGIGTSVAIARAEAAVASISDRLLQEVDDNIATAEAALSNCTGDPHGPAVAEIYECSDRIVGVAAACGLEAVASAALGVCDLIDWMQQASRFESVVLGVHVSALRLLRNDTASEAAEDVLAGLSRVRARFTCGPEAHS